MSQFGYFIFDRFGGSHRGRSIPGVEGIDIDPIVISDQQLLVISVHSDDPDLDAFNAQVQQSSSHYSTVPADLSVVSSVLLSPNRVRPDNSSRSSDRDPVFEVSG